MNRYDLYACNEAGCATNTNYSSSLIIRDQPPLKVDAPTLTTLTKNSAAITAINRITLLSNLQKILEYRFYLNSTLISSGQEATLNLTDLIPDTTYAIRLEACTYLKPSYPSGCSTSDSLLIFQTNQSSPERLGKVEFIDMPVDDYFMDLRLEWSLPEKPNGVLNLVELRRDHTIIYLSKNLSNRVFTDLKLNYGTNYAYELTFFNDGGPGSVISWHYTVESLPKVVDRPICALKTERHFFLEWKSAVFENGHILRTEVKFRKTNKEPIWNTLVIFHDLFYDYHFRVIKGKFFQFFY